jgi:N,N-dimethylformamidase
VPAPIHGSRPFSLHVHLNPTLPADGREQVLAAQQADGTGWRLYLDQRGCPTLLVHYAGRVELAVLPQPLAAHRWHRLGIAIDPVRRVALLWQAGSGAVEVPLSTGDVAFSGEITFAAALDEDGEPSGHYDGKLADPRVHGRALAAPEFDRLADSRADVPDLLASWVFQSHPSGMLLPDSSGSGFDGQLINRPMLASTGPTWSGACLDARSVPDQYSAAHFHSDDLGDVGWEPSVQFRIPDDLASGLYGVRLTGSEVTDEPAEDIVPFWVRRVAAADPARVLFLAPTFTYLAYANDRQHVTADFGSVMGDVEFSPADAWLHGHDDFGASLYDLHRDSSGFCYSTRLRPILNMRPGYVSWLTGAPRHFSSDLAILGWLDRQAVRYDVATDDDLHALGADLVDGYQVVVTGTHPEYYTREMLEALSEFTDRGGRLMYLGGNGFYWVAGLTLGPDPSLEIRRGEAGTRTWQSEPGESHLASTGEPGGLWTHRGRPPNRLVGTGFAAMGWGTGCGYRIANGIGEPLRSAVFGDLPDGADFGDYGWLGGAAGDEVDRADPARGTPENTVVLASSAGFDDRYQPVLEEQLSVLPDLGGSTNPAVRSDVTYTRVSDAGGAVFAASSVNWAGALPHDGYRNHVATITSNVLSAFLAGQL